MNLHFSLAFIFAAVLLTASGWPGESRAQTSVARVGILTVDAATNDAGEGPWLVAFRHKLAEQGWSEGRNVAFEYRDAGGDPARFTAAANELMRLKVDVIFAGSAPALRTAFAATRTIPIVGLDLTTDPIAEGYAQSHSRPGGNVTGVFLDAPGFAGKWLELLKAMIPGLAHVAVLWDPSPGSAHLQAIQSVAPSFGIQLQVLEARKPDDIDRAFSAFRGRPQALIVLPSPMLYVQSGRLAKLALKQRLPATSMFREFADSGGAVAYGPEMAATARRCAVIAAKILSGADPAVLPLAQPEGVELVVNLKTARAIGLAVPESVLAGATTVIR
jgi:putative tryptophan/tyrosine transport system substrate-binding protein